MVLPIVTLEPFRHLLTVRAAQSLAEEIQRENPHDVRIWETPTLAKTARMGHPRSMLASKGGPPAMRRFYKASLWIGKLFSASESRLAPRAAKHAMIAPVSLGGNEPKEPVCGLLTCESAT
jgi:hypothetical protein